MPNHPYPYVNNAEFEFVLTPPGYAMADASPLLIRVKVLQTYPITKSQGMKVEVISEHNGYELPSVGFLKLYDRRYLDERMKEGSKRPWDHQKEEVATSVEQELQARLAARYDKIIGSDGESDYTEEDYDREIEEMEKSNPDAVKLWEIENVFRSNTEWTFETECRAYAQLHGLQGIYLPKFYGTIAINETCEELPGILPELRGILLEFIEGVPLDEIKFDSAIALANTHIGQTVIYQFEKFVSLGVVHDDLHLANILVRADGRVFILDFGRSIVRKKEASDQEWNERVAMEGERSLLSMRLDAANFRDRTPPEPYACAITGYRSFNRFIWNARKSWRESYYEPVYDFEEFEISNDRDEEYDLPDWRLKHIEAEARRAKLEAISIMTTD